MENAPFPIMVHAEDGEVVHLSQAWLQLTGYSREEIGTIAAWTERAYGERKEMVRADIDQLYALDWSTWMRAKISSAPPTAGRASGHSPLRRSGAMTAAGVWS